MPRYKQQVTMDRGAILNGDTYGGLFLLKNWPYVSGTVSNSGRSLVWDDTNRMWFSFGTDGTNTYVFTSASGQNWVTLPANIANFQARIMSATKVPNSNFIFVGGDPAGSSSSKIYYSTDAGQSWNVPSGGVGGADAESIEATGYGINTGYIAMGNTSGHIYHSNVGTSGWSLVFTAGGSPTPIFKGVVTANNLSTPIALAWFQGSSTYYSSVNGTSWITRTFTGGTPTSVTYNSTKKLFYVATGTGQLWQSSSGVGGWTQIVNNATISIIRSFGTNLLGMGNLTTPGFGSSGVIASGDGGVTWYPVMSTNNLNHTIAVAQQHSSTFGSGTSEAIYEPHQAMLALNAPSAVYYASLKGT